jgi:hypothetical protein
VTLPDDVLAELDRLGDPAGDRYPDMSHVGR